MEQKLVLQDVDGKVLRSFNWAGQPVQVIRRQDTHRLELVESLTELEEQEIIFEKLGEVVAGNKVPLLLGKMGGLHFVDAVTNTHIDRNNPDEQVHVWRWTLLGLFAFFTLISVGLQFVPLSNAKIEEDLKQQVVKIVKSLKKPELIEKYV